MGVFMWVPQIDGTVTIATSKIPDYVPVMQQLVSMARKIENGECPEFR